MSEKTVLAEQPRMFEDTPLTIAEFCERYRISKDIYYRLRAKGETPRETRLSPRRAVILMASLREWERRKLEEGRQHKSECPPDKRTTAAARAAPPEE
ncbi:hypothetical protein B0G83_10358 [Paraburkholderia sp. BL21I4N1]|nr:hypothetical protein B0G83_10358 [Paraburkholderia sp. BL21I4N1]